MQGMEELLKDIFSDEMIDFTFINEDGEIVEIDYSRERMKKKKNNLDEWINNNYNKE